jgi:hypothetical protein
MAAIFNEDFRDFIQALNDNNVEYILVGGYAVKPTRNSLLSRNEAKLLHKL